MLLTELLDFEIQRIMKRKPTMYERGRIVGYEIALQIVRKYPLIPIEEDYVDIREYLRINMTDIIGKTDLTRIGQLGAAKSLKNLFTYCYNRVFEPTSVNEPTSSKQRQLLAIISNTIDVDFYGLTSLDANIFIKRTRK